MPINSRKKGSKNERDGAKLFKQWTGFEFARVPSSGGLRWKRTTDTTGDILCSDKHHYLVFPFSIEMKVRKECDIQKIILTNKNNDYLDFWKQANDDAVRGDKIPLLLVRYNRMASNEYYLSITTTIFKKIKHLLNLDNHYFKVQVGKGKFIVIMNSKDFFSSDYSMVLKTLQDGNSK